MKCVSEQHNCRKSRPSAQLLNKSVDSRFASLQVRQALTLSGVGDVATGFVREE